MIRRTLASSVIALALACSNPGAPLPPSPYGPFDLAACDGEYTMQTTVGSQTLSLRFDTGSSQLGVASSLCDDSCAGSALYSAGAGATDLGQTSSASYGGAQGTYSGELYRDGVRFASMTSDPVPMSLVAMTHQHGLLSPPLAACTGFVVDGILGAGPQEAADPGTDAFMTSFANAHPGVADSFTMQLCPTRGRVWFGGDPIPAMQYTPFTVDTITYDVVVSDLALDGAGSHVGVGPVEGTMTVDSGSSGGLYFIPAVYDALTSAITGLPSFRKYVSADPKFFDDAQCVPTPNVDLDATLPALTLTMPSTDGGTMTLRLPALGGYLQRKYADTQVCGNLTEFVANIIGAQAMWSSVVQIDLAHRRVGFAPSTCP